MTVALVVNILVSTLFVILRKTPGVCDVLPTTEVCTLASVLVQPISRKPTEIEYRTPRSKWVDQIG